MQGFGVKMKERDHLEHLGMDRSTILKWNLNKYGGRAWTGLTCVGQEQVLACC
jgi:hypothetical protein